MVRVAITLGILIGLAGPGQAQSSQRGRKPGDSVWVIVHHVRADKRAQYDSLMQNVWWPAAQRAGQKYPAYGRQVAERRRYVPSQIGSDSTFTYLYLYFGRPDVPRSATGGNDVLAAAGLSKAQSDSFAQAMRSYLAGSGGGPMMDEQYR
jgi:hypothetical protein